MSAKVMGVLLGFKVPLSLLLFHTFPTEAAPPVFSLRTGHLIVLL